ncbi:uncharacterized protein KY384_003847 [Bacidia gigantensis]|uniref:uncharacterized protein n=1 Tax=Bacidia gigantensis TaxID=2732470 RepID=UPI001D03ED75|nr:uncharacterized protein KY384_003847 [Bacidia gigantensis]KAG8532206.1 hypothetical protein KY384_003847 [Bacidia gigantensis]
MDEVQYPVPATAVALPLLAAITLIIDTPPFIWHARNKNFPAASLVFWILQINFFNFINALIWPTDDIARWWHGEILCDIETKLSAATYLGVVGSLIGIMRNLASVLDTKNTVIAHSEAHKPLVIHRIRKYRREFSTILSSSNSNLTKNRFTRLFCMSMSLIIVIVPTQIYNTYRFAIGIRLRYDWALVHSSNWGDIILTPTGGSIIFDRWIQIAFGFVLFAFFGMGYDAQEMYRRRSSKYGSSSSSTTLSPASEYKPFGKLSPISEHSKFTPSEVTMPASDANTTGSMIALSEMPVEPAAAHSSTSWLHTFLKHEHRTAPDRRMAAGLGIFGAPTLPRNGTGARQDKHYGGDAV